MKSSKAKPHDQSASAELATTSKKARVVALLRREQGAVMAEITEATGWLPHSARAVLTGLRKKGVTIEKSKVDSVTRWSITAEPAT